MIERDRWLIMAMISRNYSGSTRGIGTHRINGRTVPLQPGSMVLIRPGDCHGIVPTGSESIKLTNIAFPRDTLAFLQTRYASRHNERFWPEGRDPAMLARSSPRACAASTAGADALANAPRENLFLERFMLNILAELSLVEEGAAPDDAPDWLKLACAAIQQPENFSGGVGAVPEALWPQPGACRPHRAAAVRHHAHSLC